MLDIRGEINEIGNNAIKISKKRIQLLYIFTHKQTVKILLFSKYFLTHKIHHWLYNSLLRIIQGCKLATNLTLKSSAQHLRFFTTAPIYLSTLVFSHSLKFYTTLPPPFLYLYLCSYCSSNQECFAHSLKFHQSFKDHPNDCILYKIFLINFKVCLPFLWNPTALFTSFVAPITVSLAEMLLCVLSSFISPKWIEF